MPETARASRRDRSGVRCRSAGGPQATARSTAMPANAAATGRLILVTCADTGRLDLVLSAAVRRLDRGPPVGCAELVATRALPAGGGLVVSRSSFARLETASELVLGVATIAAEASVTAASCSNDWLRGENVIVTAPSGCGIEGRARRSGGMCGWCISSRGPKRCVRVCRPAPASPAKWAANPGWCGEHRGRRRCQSARSRLPRHCSAGPDSGDRDGAAAGCACASVRTGASGPSPAPGRTQGRPARRGRPAPARE